MRKKEDIPVLIAEINNELAKIEKIAQKLSAQQGRTDQEEIAESAALRLHNFYTGCERIFKLIASEINGNIPHDPEWHKRLLNQAALEINEVRPNVISLETKKALEELLRFRHIVRNLYGFELDPIRIESLIDLATRIYPQFEQDIERFTSLLRVILKNA